LADGSAIARIEEPAGILDMDYATEANLIAVAVGNGTVKLFDAETLELSAQIDNAFDQFGIVNVEITSNAGLVVTSQCGDICEAGAVRTFDVALNQQIQSVTLSDSGVLDIDISADDSTLAVVKTNGVNFHVVNTLENTAVYDNLEGFGIESVVLNTEGTSAYFAGCNNADCTEGRIGLVNAADGSLLGVVPSHSAQASLIALNPNETRFVTVADMSGEIIERNATTGEETQRFMLDLVRVASVAYTPDESRLAIGTTDGRILFEALNP